MLAGDCYQVTQSPIMQRIIRVESGGNPFAIGVVGNQLVRQPRSLTEALATANALQNQGFNFSIGKGQVNRVHFGRLGWDRSLAQGFDECTNVLAAAEIYNDCYSRAMKSGYISVPFNVERWVTPAIHAALSCYYSGDFERGARLGYVDKVLGHDKRLGLRDETGNRPRAAVSMMVD